MAEVKLVKVKMNLKFSFIFSVIFLASNVKAGLLSDVGIVTFLVQHSKMMEGGWKICYL